MYRIVFLSSYNPENRIVRSGVPYSIYHTLQKYYEVFWVKPEVTNPLLKLFIFLERCFWKVISFSVHAPLITQMPLKSFFFSLSARRKLAKIEYDGIFSLDYIDFAFLDGEKPIFMRTDAVLSGLLGYYSAEPSWLLRRVGLDFENYAMKKLCYFFVASQWVKDCMKIGSEAFPLDRTIVIKTGANLDQEMVPIKDKNLNKQSSLRLLFVGYDIKRKGIDEAFEATKILNEKYGITCRLVVMGGKPEEKMLSSGYLNYIGNMNKNDKAQYDTFYKEFEKADIFLFPTKAECHGIVNCEAAAYGLPIYSYLTGGVPDYVIDGVNGRTLPLGSTGEDFAKEIYQDLDSGIINDFSKNSRHLFETQFNWDTWGKIAKTYIDMALLEHAS